MDKYFYKSESKINPVHKNLYKSVEYQMKRKWTLSHHYTFRQTIDSIDVAAIVQLPLNFEHSYQGCMRSR